MQSYLGALLTVSFLFHSPSFLWMGFSARLIYSPWFTFYFLVVFPPPLPSSLAISLYCYKSSADLLLFLCTAAPAFPTFATATYYCHKTFFFLPVYISFTFCISPSHSCISINLQVFRKAKRIWNSKVSPENRKLQVVSAEMVSAFLQHNYMELVQKGRVYKGSCTGLRIR